MDALQPAPNAAPMQEHIPLSFPAILRNPVLNDRFGYLNANSQLSPPVASAKKVRRRGENDGRRWVRRKDNDRFVGNPHIVSATRKDYHVESNTVRSTFPEPLPSFLPRAAKLPSTELPTANPASANFGRFSLSLTGMRRELRRSGRRAEFLVRDIEIAMLHWLSTAGTVLAPDVQPPTTATARQMVGETQTIFEVSRTPFQLVWSVSDDAFARYVLHCCARYHDVVSYSKEVSGERLTYLLRPNVTRPDFFAPAAIATPPITDVDSSSQFDPESDFADTDFSDVEVASLAMSSTDSLADIRRNVDEPETWSVSGDTDNEADMSGSEAVVLPMASLTICDSDETPRRMLPIRSRQAQHRFLRSSSSPSRSPLRISFSLRQHAQSRASKPSFYSYLFS